MNLGIIGAGCYGSALAYALSSNFNEIDIYDIDRRVIEEINQFKTNKKYLSNIVFPQNVNGFTELDKFTSNKKFILIAIPSAYIRKLCITLKPYLSPDTILINVSKGFELETGKMIHEIFEEELPNNKYCTISGPSHAEEIANLTPTFLVAASKDNLVSKLINEKFTTKNLVIKTSNDVKGVEIGGCIKNIVAIGSGILTGLGYGDNTNVALMLSGIKEIHEIGVRLGCEITTLNELSGMGDLIVTCTSVHSRNRKFGYLISKGYSVSDSLKEVGTVVEGISACKSLAKRINYDFKNLDILSEVYEIVNNNKQPKSLVYKLISVNGDNNKIA